MTTFKEKEKKLESILNEYRKVNKADKSMAGFTINSILVSEGQLIQLREDKKMFLEMIEEITGLHNIKAEEIKARLFERLKEKETEK